MVSFMVMLQVDKTQIKRKIRRLLGKAHIGLNYTQQINTVLDHLEKVVCSELGLFLLLLDESSESHATLQPSGRERRCGKHC